MKLKDYIQGNKRGKEANLLEREALNDPFLEEALEGFETVTGNHTEIVDRLEKRFSKPVAAPQKKRNLFLYGSIAASILLLVGFGTYILFEKDKQPIPIFAELREIPPITNENLTPDDSPVSQPIQTEEAQPKSLITDKATEKVIPDPIRPSTALVAEESITQPENESEITDVISLSDLAEARVVEVEVMVAEYSPEFTLRAQEKQTIRKKVVDETGEPLVGVSIVAQGRRTNGTKSGIDGVFNFELPSGNSSKLIVSYLGYESQEINPYDTSQIVTLKLGNNLALNEVVVIGSGAARKSELTGSTAVSKTNSSLQSPFDEKEFQIWFKEKADKNVCEGKNISVKVTFFIDETGKPTKIEYEQYSCEEARKEVENLLASSPVWTEKNRKVSMAIKW